MALQVYERDVKAIESDGRASATHSLRAGTTTIRVLPPYSKKGLWYRRIHEYYFRLGQSHVFMPSPRDYGDPDPIWDYCDEVFASGDKQKMEVVKEWRPREVYLINAFIFSEPEQQKPYESVVALKIPKKVQRMLKTLDIDASTGYGDITHLHNGYNINVNKTGKGLTTEYQVNPHRAASNLFEELKKRGLDLNAMTLHNLDEVYPAKPTVEVQDILDTLLGAFSSSNLTPVGAAIQKAEAPLEVTTTGGIAGVPFALEGLEAPPQD